MRVHQFALLAITSLVAVPASADTADPRTETTGLGEVFFEFDSARLPADTSTRLAAVADWIKKHPCGRVILDGHADPRGTAPYNVGLGIRRAESVQSRLVAMGVPADRIYLVTYGEDGLRRSDYALDRRVTAWATEAPLHEIVDHSLVRGTAMVWKKPVTAAQIDGPPDKEVVATQ